jgi:hypothetical protein
VRLEEHILTERLGELGGRGMRRYPDLHPGRPKGPSAVPPVSGYIAWYDPSDTATLTRTGQIVTTWGDKSASGFNLTPASTFFHASVPVDSPRGLATIGFQQATLFSSTSVSRSDITSSAFVVTMVPNIASGRMLCGASGSGGNEFYVSNSGRLTTDKGGIAAIASQSNATVTLGTPFVAGQVLSATDCVQYLNLTSESDAHSQTFTAARTLQVGGSVSSASMMGWIGEIVLYDVTLSDSDAQLVIKYLMSKWGIS